MLFIILLPIFAIGVYCHPLSEARRACREEKIVYIPDNTEFYEEPVELAFDSGLNFNHVPVIKILAEECGLREKESPSKRGKRSPGDVFRLNKYFLQFYQKSRKILDPEFLEDIQNVVETLNHVEPQMERVKFARIGNFFQEVWDNLDGVLSDEKNTHVGVILEQTLRTSLQLLLQKNVISEMLLNHPTVLEKIRKRISVTNARLLSEVRVSSVECSPYHRDFQIVLYFKLRIPKVEIRTIEMCDDIGTITADAYQYYELPAATFKRDGHVMRVHIEQCAFDGFVFCPFGAVRPTHCSKEKVHHCALRKAPKENFVRELQQGFAVFGNFRQILTKQDDLYDILAIIPRTLYHMIPQSDETIVVGEHELRQNTHSKTTIIRPVKY